MAKATNKKKEDKRGGARPGAGRKRVVLSAIDKANLAKSAQEYASIALATLVEICEKGESDAARVTAANALLDRGFGKPVQGVALQDGDGKDIDLAKSFATFITTMNELTQSKAPAT